MISKFLTVNGVQLSPNCKNAKQLNTVGHTEIYAWGVVHKSACLIGVVGLDMKP
ncbi:conserved hypothetical protein [Microcystis aeruginosa PCC 9443]|uniref:Uncharacterized protein n=1 Tax=Microcystis aeruginosa PCC 9443 TaxID=1160281 RepID=I4G211_MICAE|nr:conserved hypothetical protein [Microcystis aeruginosa PCC 9443]